VSKTSEDVQRRSLWYELTHVNGVYPISSLSIDRVMTPQSLPAERVRLMLSFLCTILYHSFLHESMCKTRLHQ
jgi:hypothetical protein